MSKQIIRAAAAALTAVVAGGAAVLVAPVASADDDVERRGSCDATSRWHAEAEHDDGGIEVKLEVKSTRAGQRWRATITQDGTRILASTRTAVRDDDDDDDDSRWAEAEWKVNARDRAGTDRFVLRAVNQSTGEVCRATLAI